MRWLSVLALGLGACASAGGRDNPGDGPAAGDGPPTIDAPPQLVMLSQNGSTAPNGGSFACHDNNFTRENSYYRVFSLADHGVPGPFEVRSVTFAIQTANAGGSSQPAQVKIGRYTGTPGGPSLSVADIVPINSVAIQIADGSTSITTAISGVVPAGSHLIVELAIPDGLAAQNQFFIGTNAAGESRPGYIRAPNCNALAPTGMNALGAQQSPPLAKADLIMTVTGLKY